MSERNHAFGSPLNNRNNMDQNFRPNNPRHNKRKNVEHQNSTSAKKQKKINQKTNGSNENGTPSRQNKNKPSLGIIPFDFTENYNIISSFKDSNDQKIEYKNISNEIVKIEKNDEILRIKAECSSLKVGDTTKNTNDQIEEKKESVITIEDSKISMGIYDPPPLMDVFVPPPLMDIFVPPHRNPYNCGQFNPWNYGLDMLRARNQVPENRGFPNSRNFRSNNRNQNKRKNIERQNNISSKKRKKANKTNSGSNQNCKPSRQNKNKPSQGVIPIDLTDDHNIISSSKDNNDKIVEHKNVSNNKIVIKDELGRKDKNDKILQNIADCSSLNVGKNTKDTSDQIPEHKDSANTIEDSNNCKNNSTDEKSTNRKAARGKNDVTNKENDGKAKDSNNKLKENHPDSSIKVENSSDTIVMQKIDDNQNNKIVQFSNENLQRNLAVNSSLVAEKDRVAKIDVDLNSSGKHARNSHVEKNGHKEKTPNLIGKLKLVPINFLTNEAPKQSETDKKEQVVKTLINDLILPNTITDLNFLSHLKKHIRNRVNKEFKDRKNDLPIDEMLNIFRNRYLKKKFDFLNGFIANFIGVSKKNDKNFNVEKLHNEINLATKGRCCTLIWRNNQIDKKDKLNQNLNKKDTENQLSKDTNVNEIRSKKSTLKKSKNKVLVTKNQYKNKGNQVLNEDSNKSHGIIPVIDSVDDALIVEANATNKANGLNHDYRNKINKWFSKLFKNADNQVLEENINKFKNRAVLKGSNLINQIPEKTKESQNQVPNKSNKSLNQVLKESDSINQVLGENINKFKTRADGEKQIYKKTNFLKGSNSINQIPEKTKESQNQVPNKSNKSLNQVLRENDSINQVSKETNASNIEVSKERNASLNKVFHDENISELQNTKDKINEEIKKRDSRKQAVTGSIMKKMLKANFKNVNQIFLAVLKKKIRKRVDEIVDDFNSHCKHKQIMKIYKVLYPDNEDANLIQQILSYPRIKKIQNCQNLEELRRQYITLPNAIGIARKCFKEAMELHQKLTANS